MRVRMAHMQAEGAALVAATESHLAAWVVGCVSRFTGDEAVLARAGAVGKAAAAAVAGELADLLAADIDAQPTTPLAVLRSAVRHPTSVLAAAGIPPVDRDAFARDRFPDDLYGLTPATFADIHPAVGEAGLAWGAARVVAHRARHGAGR